MRWGSACVVNKESPAILEKQAAAPALLSICSQVVVGHPAPASVDGCAVQHQQSGGHGRQTNRLTLSTPAAAFQSPTPCAAPSLLALPPAAMRSMYGAAHCASQVVMRVPAHLANRV
jgi:hypothetical protein